VFHAVEKPIIEGSATIGIGDTGMARQWSRLPGRQAESGAAIDVRRREGG